MRRSIDFEACQPLENERHMSTHRQSEVVMAALVARHGTTYLRLVNCFEFLFVNVDR